MITELNPEYTRNERIAPCKGAQGIIAGQVGIVTQMMMMEGSGSGCHLRLLPPDECQPCSLG